MNLDQVRAANAFAFVQQVAKGQDPKPGDFLGLARKLPVMLQTNGLLATWAHLLAKNGAEYGKMAEAMLKHFQHEEVGRVDPAQPNPKDVFLDVWTQAQTGERDLRRLTQEAIVYSVWLKRAAEALCEQSPPANTAENEK